MTTTATFLCPCGSRHPVGAPCRKAPAPLMPSLTTEDRSCGCCAERAPEPQTGRTDDTGEELPHPPRAADCGCPREHAAPQPADLSALAEAVLESTVTRAIYYIPNMDCPMEEALIRKKLGPMPGVAALEFNLMRRLLTVSHDLASTAPLEAALKSVGMTPEPLALNRDRAALPSESGATPAVPDAGIPWLRLVLAGILAALSEMFELIHDWNAAPFGLSPHGWKIGGFGLMEHLPVLLAVTAILIGGLGTYKKGWIAVKNLNLNINALMSVAVTGAALIGQYPEAAMVMVLFNLAEAIEAKSLDRARNAVKNLLGLAPERAAVLKDGQGWVETDIRQVSIGSLVRVKPGERIALDGIVVRGRSSVNQAPITGESLPVEKTEGDPVYAGTINESGSFEFEVTAAAGNSTLARIIHAVEEAQGSRAPIQRFVDQFARYYTPAIFLTAFLVAVVPPLFIDVGSGETVLWSEWIYTALVILVIGCPCALVISTPVSIVSAMAAGTKSGILIKGGLFLEQGRLLKYLALDKTGTITHGKPRQTDFIAVGSFDRDRSALLAAALAARSDHPVSVAIAENAAKAGLALPEVEDFTALPGRGISGVIAGERWRLGNRRLIEELGQASPELEAIFQALEQEGKSVTALAGEDGVRGLFAVADTIRESSREAIRELKRLGVRTIMLTGDNEHTARVIARQTGVDEYLSGLLPQDKLDVVKRLAADGRVGMAGDGINDAPALAGADIGFAMAAAGTGTAIETADVALMDDDLRKIPRFIRLSKSTYAILAQNIILALGVKAVFLALTFAGLATMWMAVFADVGTSLLVVANALRALRK